MIFWGTLPLNPYFDETTKSVYNKKSKKKKNEKYIFEN